MYTPPCLRNGTQQYLGISLCHGSLPNLITSCLSEITPILNVMLLISLLFFMVIPQQQNDMMVIGIQQGLCTANFQARKILVSWGHNLQEMSKDELGCEKVNIYYYYSHCTDEETDSYSLSQVTQIFNGKGFHQLS